MSVYRNSVRAFIQILEEKSNLISTIDWDELSKLPSSLPENDDEEVSEQIETWLQAQPHRQILKEAYEQNLKSLYSPEETKVDADLGIGGAKSPTPPNQASPSSKELLDNAIKRNSPLSDNAKLNEKP
jgi:hypothetical protein